MAGGAAAVVDDDGLAPSAGVANSGAKTWANSRAVMSVPPPAA